MYICVRFLGDELLLLCLVMVLYHHTLPTRQIRYPFENDIWLLVTAAEEKEILAVFVFVLITSSSRVLWPEPLFARPDCAGGDKRL